MFAKEIIAARFGGVCHWVVVYSLSHLIYACHLYFSISDLHVIPLPLCCAPHQSTMICTYFRKRSTVLSYRRLIADSLAGYP
jgi:hypothetical protein